MIQAQNDILDPLFQHEARPAQSGRPDADGKAHALSRRIKSGQQRLAAGRENFMATPHNSASGFGERFFVKSRFGTCRNAVCISNFPNRRIGGKYPPKCEDAIVRYCLIFFTVLLMGCGSQSESSVCGVVVFAELQVGKLDGRAVHVQGPRVLLLAVCGGRRRLRLGVCADELFHVLGNGLGDGLCAL